MKLHFLIPVLIVISIGACKAHVQSENSSLVLNEDLSQGRSIYLDWVEVENLRVKPSKILGISKGPDLFVTAYFCRSESEVKTRKGRLAECFYGDDHPGWFGYWSDQVHVPLLDSFNPQENYTIESRGIERAMRNLEVKSLDKLHMRVYLSRDKVGPPASGSEVVAGPVYFNVGELMRAKNAKIDVKLESNQAKALVKASISK